MTDLFTRLSEDLAGFILFEWLREEEIGKLDSALCVKASRKNFLSILQTCSPNRNWCQIGPQFRWLRLRNIRTRFLYLKSGSHISHEDTITEFIDYLAHGGSFIKAVTFADKICPVDTAINTINAITTYCHNLERLTVYRHLTDAHLINISKHCLKLKSLRYLAIEKEQMSNITDFGVSEVARTCLQLTSLTLLNCTELSNLFFQC